MTLRAVGTGCVLLLACVLVPAGCERAKQASAPAAKATAPRTVDERPFPRTYPVDGKVFEVHQPQLDSWDGRTLKGRFVLSVKTGTRKGADGKPEELRDFGVVWFSATTQVDTAARTVVLSDVVFERDSFPTARAREAEYLQTARSIPGRGATWTMSLDHLEAGLAVSAMQAVSQRVLSDPPEIIFSTEPAILLAIDGKPVLHPVGEGVERIVNTRAVLLRAGNDFYTRIAGHWAQAPALIGPWAWLAGADPRIEAALKQLPSQTGTIDKPSPALERAFADGVGPRLYVRSSPAELIAIQGDPMFVAIPGTRLSYIDNTGADVFVDGGHGNAIYVLVSGRWFTAPSTRGPWSHVAKGRLPEDFSRIPPDSPKSNVLASIPGTPEAREALVANSIPQSATVSRKETKLEVPYDGEPNFAPIEGTKLEYAHNSPVPVIHVPGTGYFAVDKGVWFEAKTPTGPWEVADSVPEEIYSIPTSSPLHYVTYVRVYGAKDDEVFVGYTPGYYGTVVSDDVVVYGTGYECDPWVGEEDWYGCPATYGMGTYFGWSPYVGWTYGWGWGWYDGWYGSWNPWWGPWRGDDRPFGWWNGGAAAWNVYEQWGGTAVRGTAAAWVNARSGDVGRAFRGGGYDRDTGVATIGRAGMNTNLRTGTSVAAARGLRYDTNTGRVSGAAGIARDGPNGAAAIGAAAASGPRGEIAAVGGARYSERTGEAHRGGIATTGDSVYASRDGEVYKFTDGAWSKVDLPAAARMRDAPVAAPTPRGVGSPGYGAGVGAPPAGTGVGSPGYGAGVGSPGYGAGVGADLDSQRFARDLGYQRGGGGYSGGGQGRGNSFQGMGNTHQGGGTSAGISSGGGYSGSRPAGGYRSSLGSSPGRMGGGGGRRR
jgi:hypothetical protein